MIEEKMGRRGNINKKFGIVGVLVIAALLLAMCGTASASSKINASFTESSPTIDGNHNHVLDGSISEPHVDIIYKKGAPSACPKYDEYSYYDLTGAYEVTPPTGAESGSSGSSITQYEFKIPLSDLTARSGDTVGIQFCIRNPSLVHDYVFPYVENYVDPENWADLTLEAAKQVELEVSVTTDKTTYTTGDLMNVEINITNPSGAPQSVVFGWWLTIPSFDYMTVPMATIPMTLPAGYDEAFTYPIYVGYWSEESFGAVWGVALSDPKTNEIMSFDATHWNYVPSKAAKVKKSPVSIGREIRKEIERVELPS